jgi:predicted nucleic acid-binding protein
VIYLDSSALLKLIFEEPESDALEGWLSSRASVPKVSSELAKVEVLRASRRMAPDTVPAAVTMLSQLDLVPLSGGVVEHAAYLGETSLRGLDAFHLASAVTLGSDLTAFIAYDHRLSAAASDLGLEVLQPGA